MIWVDAKELQQWAGRRDSQSTLPYLVRRLIRATCNDIDLISFPAGDSISKSGWDGRLITNSGNEYIPEGISVWEFGTDQKIGSKAESDYRKRCNNPLGFDPSQTTYVFVTPRPFTKNQKWVEEKKAENIWKDVRAFNSDNLEEWIEQAPGVGLWLALHLNRTYQDVKSAEDWWNEWIKATNPTFTSDIVISGRKTEEEKIIKCLKKHGCYPIAGNTTEEVIAFIIASFLHAEDNILENFISRAVIVVSEESYRKLVYEIQRPLILISLINSPELHSIAEEKGHVVFLPVGFDDSDLSDETIILPKGDHQSFIDALIKMGYSREEAYQFEKDTNRNLSIFRRKVLKIKKNPDWITDQNLRELIPFILVGRWDSNKKYKDYEILASLNNCQYEQVEITANKWENVQDSPIKHNRTIWRLQSHYDTWERIGRKLTVPDYECLKKISSDVYCSDNPIFDLDLEKRWMAELYGKIPPYSQHLRKGIGTTILLIAVFGDKFKFPISISAQSYVDSIVFHVFKEANGRRWCSLNDVLPILAEASPSIFLDSIEESLEATPSPIMDIFPEEDNQMHPSNTHTGLLWGLETLAWDPNYLGRVTLILLELSKRDPGGVYVNRPYNSLKSIFLLWFPHTYASFESRKRIIDIIIKTNPEIGWNLLIDLIDEKNKPADNTLKPQWRKPDIESEPPVTREELDNSIEFVVERILTNINKDGIKWTQLLDIIQKIPGSIRDIIYTHIRSLGSLETKDHLEIWNALRSILAHHKSHPTALWVFSEGELLKINDLYELLTPPDKIDALKWLFDSPLPNLTNSKFYCAQYKNDLREKRKEALFSIYEEKGKDGIIDLIIRSDYPQIIGESCIDTDEIFNDEDLFTFLDSDTDSLKKFSQKFIQIKSYLNEDEWIEKSIFVSINEKWSPNKIVNLLVVLPEKEHTWRFITNFPDAIQKNYWERCEGAFYNLSSDERNYGLSKLMEVGRINTAILIASISDKDLAPLLIIDLLECRIKTAINKEIDQEGIDSYHIIELFKWLDDVIESKPELIPRIITLEIIYLPILSEIDSGRPPKYIFQAIFDNPEIFSDMIETVFKSEEDKTDEKEESPISQDEKNKINACYEILTNLRIFADEEDKDEKVFSFLNNWVISTKKLCREKKRGTVGDYYIGRLLGSIPYNDEIEWPPEEICSIIEETSTSSIRNGFFDMVIEQRGVTSRSITEGGVQERELIDRFMQLSQNLSKTYPRTSGLLQKIVAFYRDDAKFQDDDAEIMDYEY